MNKSQVLVFFSSGPATSTYLPTQAMPCLRPSKPAAPPLSSTYKHVKLWYVMLCYVMICYVMLCTKDYSKLMLAMYSI